MDHRVASALRLAGGERDQALEAVEPDDQLELVDLVGDVLINSVAVDSKDHVVFTGFYEDSIDLFGDTFVAFFAEPGRVTGAYMVSLDANGAVVWKVGRANGSEANGVAIDPSDNAIMIGAVTGNVGFDRITLLDRFDPAGAETTLAEMFPASGYGRGIAVATDACGSIYTTVNALDQPNANSPLHVYVLKIDPQNLE
jgi:hypothetical protein